MLQLRLSHHPGLSPLLMGAYPSLLFILSCPPGGQSFGQQRSSARRSLNKEYFRPDLPLDPMGVRAYTNHSRAEGLCDCGFSCI